MEIERMNEAHKPILELECGSAEAHCFSLKLSPLTRGVAGGGMSKESEPPVILSNSGFSNLAPPPTPH